MSCDSTRPSALSTLQSTEGIRIVDAAMISSASETEMNRRGNLSTGSGDNHVEAPVGRSGKLRAQATTE